MSHTRVKTRYAEQGAYASTDYMTLYCDHNQSCDITTFYDEKGGVVSMCFGSWESGNDLWDAMNRLWFPFKDKWGDELLDGVSYWDKEDYEKLGK
jgi:hypothetical protein